MQWDSSPNAGFTGGTPWLPVPPSYKTHNVAVESRDPQSILEHYRRLLALRHQDPALLEGDYVDLTPENSTVFSYLRRYRDEAVLVVLNMSSSTQTVSLGSTRKGFSIAHRVTLLSTPGQSPGSGPSFTLQPFAVYIARLTR
jgi:glycosidase